MTNKIRDLDIKLDIISKLLDAIEKYPEERIGQIIYNCTALYFGPTVDTFYLEDWQILESFNSRLL